jgi:hypothetical protein
MLPRALRAITRKGSARRRTRDGRLRVRTVEMPGTARLCCLHIESMRYLERYL